MDRPLPVSRGAAWAAVVVATLTMTVSYVDRTTLAVLAPKVRDALDFDTTQYGWLVSTFSVAYLIGTPIGGWWIDRAGARWGLVVSLVAWSAVAGLHAVAPTLGVLLGLRFLLGLAEGPGFPGAAQTVQRLLPERDRARGFGVLFTGSSIGGAIAPVLAAWILRHQGWRVAFLGTTLVGLVWVPLWLAVTHAAPVRAALGPTPPAPRRARPALFDLVRDRFVIRALFGVFAAAPIMGFVQAFGSLYLVDTFGLRTDEVGHYLWLPPLVFDLGAILFGDLASRARAHVRVPYAIAIALGTAIAALPLAATPWQAMAIMSVAMAGGGGLYTIVTADLLGRAAPELVSFTGGVLAGAQSLALIAMSPIVGWSATATGGYTAAALGIGAWVVPGSLVWVLWRLRGPREQRAEG